MFTVTANGNLGSDIEVRYTEKGTTIYSFRMATRTGRSKRGEDGTWSDTPTTWVKVTSFRMHENTVAKLTKGTRVLVSGQLEIGSFVDRNNVERPTYDIVAEQIEVVLPGGSKVEADEEGNGVVPVAARASASAEPAVDLAELPF